MYRLEYAKPAAQELRRLPKAMLRLVIKRIEALAHEPRPEGAVSLSGEQALYRVRQGKYRVIYRVQDDVLTVLIVKVGHRGEVYRKL